MKLIFMTLTYPHYIRINHGNYLHVLGVIGRIMKLYFIKMYEIRTEARIAITAVHMSGSMVITVTNDVR